MKKTVQRPKLRLSTEKVRELTETQLAAVGGGEAPHNTTTTAPHNTTTA